MNQAVASEAKPRHSHHNHQHHSDTRPKLAKASDLMLLQKRINSKYGHSFVMQERVK